MKFKCQLQSLGSLPFVPPPPHSLVAQGGGGDNVLGGGGGAQTEKIKSLRLKLLNVWKLVPTFFTLFHVVFEKKSHSWVWLNNFNMLAFK